MTRTAKKQKRSKPKSERVMKGGKMMDRSEAKGWFGKALNAIKQRAATKNEREIARQMAKLQKLRAQLEVAKAKGQVAKLEAQIKKIEGGRPSLANKLLGSPAISKFMDNMNTNWDDPKSVAKYNKKYGAKKKAISDE